MKQPEDHTNVSLSLNKFTEKKIQQTQGAHAKSGHRPTQSLDSPITMKGAKATLNQLWHAGTQLTKKNQ